MSMNSFHVSLYIRIVLFYLLTVEGIESNPGPPTMIPDYENRGRGCGRGSPRPPPASASASIMQTRGAARLTRSQSGQPDQTTLNAWLNNGVTPGASQQDRNQRYGETGSHDNFRDLCASDDSGSESGDLRNDNDDINGDLLSSFQSCQDIDLKTILLEVRSDVKHVEKIWLNRKISTLA